MPFCARRCDYCAFYVYEKAASGLRREYLTRLESELKVKSEYCDPLATIYIGGGTPTYFSTRELREMLTMVTENFQFEAGYEFTVESNPDCLTPAKLTALIDGGVNRISTGIQSFSQGVLDAIGRPGKIERAYEAVDAIRASGIGNFNCDLIFGVPGQTISDWENDLKEISQLAPPHISAYSLMIEENTKLAESGTVEGDDELLSEMWNLAGEYLENHCGLRRYEISNYAKTGFECRHNQRIWMGNRFIGAGPSACYFDGVSRWTNPTTLASWLKNTPAVEDAVSSEQRAVEILITGLRTVDGWERFDFERVTGFDYSDIRGETICELTEAGLLVQDVNSLRLSNQGLLLADFIARELL